MNYNYLLNGRKPNKEKLVANGFEPSGNAFVLRADLPNSLYVLVKISEKTIAVDVFDGLFNVKYAPFYSGHGGGGIKTEVHQILENILNSCCEKST